MESSRRVAVFCAFLFCSQLGTVSAFVAPVLVSRKKVSANQLFSEPTPNRDFHEDLNARKSLSDFQRSVQSNPSFQDTPVGWRPVLLRRLENLSLRQLALFLLASLYDLGTAEPATASAYLGSVHSVGLLPPLPVPPGTLTLAAICFDLTYTLWRHAVEYKTLSFTNKLRRLEHVLATNSTVDVAAGSLAAVSKEYSVAGHGCEYFADGVWHCT